jgi:prepilin-type processing-associated H-X9-DG protein
MSETNNSPQGQRPRTCWLAVASLVCGGVGAFLMLLSWLLYIAFGDSAGYLYCCLEPVFWICAVLGLGGIISVVSSKGRLVGVKWAVFGILIWAGLIRAIIYGFEQSHLEAEKCVCGAHLSGLGKAMVTYAAAHDGKYPTPDKWCDLLVEGNYAAEKQFICRGASSQEANARCHYAVNPNCEPNSPSDMVLLFETKGGWNQFGGPEILTTENHGGKGCNILFNDGSVRFVKPEELRKLKWKVEEPNTIE